MVQDRILQLSRIACTFCTARHLPDTVIDGYNEHDGMPCLRSHLSDFLNRSQDHEGAVDGFYHAANPCALRRRLLVVATWLE